jgi:hypothetical protein
VATIARALARPRAPRTPGAERRRTGVGRGSKEADMMRKALLFLLCASIPVVGRGAPSAGNPGAAPRRTLEKAPPAAQPSGGACSFLDAATISKITGLNITKVTNDGDSCVYVDPTAPLNAVVQQFGQAISMAFSGESPLRLNGAPNGVPAPQSGAGVIVRLPSGGDLTKVSVHDYVQGILAQVPAEAQCGSLQDVSGLNAASVVCLGGAIGHGGVVKDDKAVQIMYLASGNATNDVMGALLAAAAANM